MFVFPVPDGEWTMEASTEGAQFTSSTSDPNKGKVDGLIAFSDDKSKVWNMGIMKNCEITNNKADNSWKYGHPDLEVNNCHFKNRQCLEMDGAISCHIKTTGPEASIFIVGPAVQLQSKYNYAISYGSWTDRDMEFGSITVTFDEKVAAMGSKRSAKKWRNGHSPSYTEYRLAPHPTIEVDSLREPEMDVAVRSHSPPYTPPQSPEPYISPPNSPMNSPVDPRILRPMSEADLIVRAEESKGIKPFPPTGNFGRDYDNKENIDPRSWNLSPEEVLEANNFPASYYSDIKEQVEQKGFNAAKKLSKSKPPLAPSLGGSRLSTLSRGFLRPSASSLVLQARMSGLNAEQRYEYERAKATMGKTAAEEKLKEYGV